VSSPEVDEVVRRVAEWARDRDDVRALALVGSRARGDARADSDVDLVLLTPAPGAVGDGWLAALPRAELVRSGDWGAIAERRARLPSGLEVEVGIGEPSWAATDPVDPGTRRVVADGLRIVHDPDGLLARLVEECGLGG
jgi:predicted nucleotidyltransferase